jgi:hypothetical protein
MKATMKLAVASAARFLPRGVQERRTIPRFGDKHKPFYSRFHTAHAPLSHLMGEEFPQGNRTGGLILCGAFFDILND